MISFKLLKERKLPILFADPLTAVYFVFMVSGTYYILKITEDLKELLLCELYISVSTVLEV